MADSGTPDISRFVGEQALWEFLVAAYVEDMGNERLDVTSAAMIGPERQCVADVVTRQAGVLAGASLIQPAALAYDPDIETQGLTDDGQSIDAGQRLARLRGPLRRVLGLERTLLNLLTHLSGIATLTRRYVDQATGTAAKVYDTRKTHAGLRALEKYAVACGGGYNHRLGLFDAMLIKDNHLAHVRTEDLAQTVSRAVSQARADHPQLKFVEIEVDSLDQLEQVLTAPIDIALLDNMDHERMTAAVDMRDRLAPHVALEASGGVNLETTKAIAHTGVDRIAVGALTHSAPALDIGLDIHDM